MAWVRLDDSFFEHPKIVGLSDGAFRLHVGAICYAARNMTDGWVRASAARLLGSTSRSVAALVAAGLWERGADGWQLHDWLDYNLSAEELRRQRGSRVDAGRFGGERSGVARRAKQMPPNEGSKTEARASPFASRLLEAKPNPDPDPDPVPVPDPDPPAAAAAAATAGAAEEPLPLLLRHWERATGTTVTPAFADWLDGELGEGTPLDWLRDAISETGANGSKAWKYTRAIIERWRLHGREPRGRSDRRQPAGTPARGRSEETCRATGPGGNSS